MHLFLLIKWDCNFIFKLENLLLSTRSSTEPLGDPKISFKQHKPNTQPKSWHEVDYRRSKGRKKYHFIYDLLTLFQFKIEPITVYKCIKYYTMYRVRVKWKTSSNIYRNNRESCIRFGLKNLKLDGKSVSYFIVFSIHSLRHHMNMFVHHTCDAVTWIIKICSWRRCLNYSDGDDTFDTCNICIICEFTGILVIILKTNIYTTVHYVILHTRVHASLTYQYTYMYIPIYIDETVIVQQ